MRVLLRQFAYFATRHVRQMHPDRTNLTTSDARVRRTAKAVGRPLFQSPNSRAHPTASSGHPTTIRVQSVPARWPEPCAGFDRASENFVALAAHQVPEPVRDATSAVGVDYAGAAIPARAAQTTLRPGLSMFFQGYGWPPDAAG